MKTSALKKIKLLLIKVYVTFIYLLHLLVGNLFGIFILSLLLYHFAPALGLGQPLSAHELILWIDQLPETYKVTVFTSLLTIIGFLIAFSIGSAQQKQQFISQMKIEIASDIEEFFNEASRKSTDADIYARYLLEVASIINDGVDQNSIDYHMHNIIKETNKFTQIRELLMATSIEVHRFQGKYSIILASTWGVNKQLEKAIEAFTEITDAMWFSTPLINTDTKNKDTVFLRHVKTDECQKFITAYKNNYSIMNGTTGGLRGRLIAPITGMNLSFIISLLKLK